MNQITTYRTLKSPIQAEFKDKGSRFLAFAYPVQTAEQVKKHVDDLRQEHHKARHWCYAYRFGVDGNQFRANDDGEPSGSAGRPILGQIDSFELTDVLVVVVRYFGGTLLGTGGLVKVYTQAAQAVLEDAQTEEFVERSAFELNLSYQNYEACRFLFEKFCITGLRETFAETVVLSGFVQTSLKNDFEKKIKDVCAGSLL